MNFTKLIHTVAIVLVIIGGLNWGMIGFFDHNLVASFFGAGMATKVIYDLVGLSALYLLLTKFKRA